MSSLAAKPSWTVPMPCQPEPRAPTEDDCALALLPHAMQLPYARLTPRPSTPPLFGCWPAESETATATAIAIGTGTETEIVAAIATEIVTRPVAEASTAG